MKQVVVFLSALSLTGCAPSWPSDKFPDDAKVERTLFSEYQFGLREGCQATVVELSDAASFKLIGVRSVKDVVEVVPPVGWSKTPMPDDPKRHAYFEGAFGGCNNSGRRPLGDLPGALKRPGAFYRVINGGEGIGIIVPSAKLAGFFYAG